MNISILTPDSNMPNLAAMKISAWHKKQGHNVELNFPLLKADFTYASILFNETLDPANIDLVGGPKYPEIKLDPEIDKMFPDYSLYPDIDYSIGYTYKACPRTCDHCIVPRQQNDECHYHIWTFHNPKFKKICLMNNNTLADPFWRETFREIDNAGLSIIEHGFDARLINEYSAKVMSKMKFTSQIHVAWDFPEHEDEIITGIMLLTKYINPNKISCYVLIGNTTHTENMHRVNLLHSLGVTPFIMKLNRHDRYQKDFARYVNRFIYKKVYWEDYKN